MGFSDDRCLKTFSDGQSLRMREMYQTFRTNSLNGFMAVCFERVSSGVVSARQCFPPGTYTVDSLLTVVGTSNNFFSGASWIQSGSKVLRLDNGVQIETYTGLNLSGARSSWTSSPNSASTVTTSNTIRSFRITRRSAASESLLVCAFPQTGYQGTSSTCYSKGTVYGNLAFTPASIQFGTSITQVTLFSGSCGDSTPLATLRRSSTNLRTSFPTLSGRTIRCMSIT